MTLSRHTMRLRPAQWRSAWRWCVVLVSVLSLVLMLASAGSHVHDSAVAVHDCVVCSAVVDQLAEAPAAMLLVVDVQYRPYYLAPAPVGSCAPSIDALPPPSCGPPAFPA